MMPRMPKSPKGCPMDSLLRLLMGPWTAYILWTLCSKGPQRFGALKREVEGVSAKVLTERLRMLESARVVYRHYEPTVPPRVTYGLTEHGKELTVALGKLYDVARKWHEEGELGGAATAAE